MLGLFEFFIYFRGTIIKVDYMTFKLNWQHCSQLDLNY
jgi:hypothetical protein